MVEAAARPAGDGSPPVFSVIIPTWNDGARLRTCLDALGAQVLPAAGFEVIVADNGSREPVAALCARYPFATCVMEPRPGSYNARNTACALARGRILAFTDADCIPDARWLANAVKYFEPPHSCDAIGGEVVVLTSPRRGVAELYDSVYGFDQRRRIVADGYAVTANMLVRREVFGAVGPFAGELLSGGDREWGARLGAHGRSLCFAADVIVRHPARTTVAQLMSKRRRTVGGTYTLRRAKGGRVDAGALREAALRNAAEARGRIRLLRDAVRHGLTRRQAMAVLLLKRLLWATGKLERLRLLLGGSPLRQ